jgi:hypothetical protein
MRKIWHKDGGDGLSRRLVLLLLHANHQQQVMDLIDPNWKSRRLERDCSTAATTGLHARWFAVVHGSAIVAKRGSKEESDLSAGQRPVNDVPVQRRLCNPARSLRTGSQAAPRVQVMKASAAGDLVRSRGQTIW